MSFEYEKSVALRILEGIEQGSMSAGESFNLISDAEPVLVALIFKWLRAHYYPQHPAADGVLGRLVTLCTAHPSVPRKAKQGESDVIVEWFEDTYSYRDLGSREFIDLIVEKLEG